MGAAVSPTSFSQSCRGKAAGISHKNGILSSSETVNGNREIRITVLDFLAVLDVLAVLAV